MTAHEKHARLVFDDGVRIDIKQVIEGSKVKYFAINVSLIVGDTRHDVFRVDTAHGYLHQQRFWISDKPEKLQSEKKKDYKGDLGNWKDKVIKNYKEYVELYRKKLKGELNEKEES